MKEWKKTDEAGVYRHREISGKYKIHTTATDPETGKVKHRRHTMTNATMLKAIKKRGELKAEIRRPTADHLQKKLFADFVADWMADRIDEGRWAESTANKNRRIIEHHIVPILGNLYVDEIDREAIRGWIDYAQNARRERKGEMVPYAHSTLRGMWGRIKELVNGLYLAGHCEKRLVDWCRDRRGPTSDVAPRRETRTLTLEELHQYVETARQVAPKRYAEIVTLAYTGMRAGELYGLEWRHIDGTIKIEQSVSRSGKLKGTKTGRNRTAPMVPAVEAALDEQRQKLMREQNPGLREGIVFPTRSGGRRISQSLHKPMRRVATACNIDVKVGPQVLRKTFITLMGNLGVRREMVMAITGHETEAMHAHYTEIRDEDRRTAVDRLFAEGIA